MNIADASLEECRYYLILSSELGYADTSALMLMLEETSRSLQSYNAALLRSNH
jgi:four helix bundle protein